MGVVAHPAFLGRSVCAPSHAGVHRSNLRLGEHPWGLSPRQTKTRPKYPVLTTSVQGSSSPARCSSSSLPWVRHRIASRRLGAPLPGEVRQAFDAPLRRARRWLRNPQWHLESSLTRPPCLPHLQPCHRSPVSCCSAASLAAPGPHPAEPARAHADTGNLWSRFWRWWNVDATEDESLPPPAQLPVLGRQLWKLISPDRPILAVATVLLVCAALSELAIPHFVSASIFAAVTQRSEALFYRNVTILATLSLSYGLFSGARGACFSYVNQRMVRRMREQLFRTLTYVPSEHPLDRRAQPPPPAP